MGCMTEPCFPDTPIKREAAYEKPAKSALTRADEAGHASFPASDPPAVWTWEVNREPSEIEVDRLR